jgi:hypothetical protein
MAKEAPGIQNKLLLIIAGVLALVVVVAYNLHVSGLRSQMNDVKGYKYRILRDLEAGDTLQMKDLEAVSVTAPAWEALKDVVGYPANGSVDDGTMQLKTAMKNPLKQKLQRNKWLRWDDLGVETSKGPADRVPPGKVARALPVADIVPGELVQIGGRVNLLGDLPDGKGGVRCYRVIEGLEVFAIAGKGTGEVAGAPSAGVAKTTYRTVTVACSKDVSIKLQNIMSHIRGGAFTLEVARPGDKISDDISSEKPVVDAAAAPSVAKGGSPS